jgi:hypothetical protein
MEYPRTGRDDESDREQLAGEQLARGPKRMLDVDRRCLAGTAMLVQEADVGGQCARKRERDTEDQIDRQGNFRGVVADRTRSCQPVRGAASVRHHRLTRGAGVMLGRRAAAKANALEDTLTASLKRNLCADQCSYLMSTA